MSSFVIDAAYPNHRLLHASLKPPVKPDHETLLQMREYATLGGLALVMSELDAPITQHLQVQLDILAIDPEEAWDRINTGEYLHGDTTIYRRGL